ncbi:MAG: hypothetical protein LWW85_07265, partial [Marinilabiliales bacterium]|nr:hypothetical protein [Marinilabiliales bacterium]
FYPRPPEHAAGLPLVSSFLQTFNRSAVDKIKPSFFPSPASGLPSPVTGFLSPVSGFLSPVSCLPSPVSLRIV